MKDGTIKPSWQCRNLFVFDSLGCIVVNALTKNLEIHFT
jgi:hypothetical protein